MSRSSTLTTAALLASALALPAGAGAAPTSAEVRLEARAVADSAQAVRLAEDSAGRARRAIRSSELALRRAYRMGQAQGHQASVRFTAAAEAQGANLAEVVEQSRGRLKSTAADALAATARMEAAVVDRTSRSLEATQSATAGQGEQATAVGEAHASLTASVVVAASTDRLRDGLRRMLDGLTAKAIAAQARLALAVEELRERTRGQSEAGMAAAEASMQDQASDLAEALRGSGRWEVTYDKTVGTDSPVSASASLHARVVVEQGDRR